MKLFKYFTSSNTSSGPLDIQSGQEIEVKKFPGKVKSVLVENLICKQFAESGERRISGLASTPVVDRGGDIVEVSAFMNTMDKFGTNPIMLFMHNMNQPIGVWDKHELRKDGLWVSGRIATGIPEADKAWALIEQGILRGLSIGFMEKDAVVMDDEKYHIRDLELLEISIVSIPMNQDALFTFDGGGKLLDIELIADTKSVASVKEDENMEKLQEQINELKSAIFAITIDSKEIEQVREEITGLNEKLNALQKQSEEITNQVKDLNKCMYALVADEITKIAEKYNVTPGTPPESPED